MAKTLKKWLAVAVATMMLTMTACSGKDNSSGNVNDNKENTNLFINDEWEYAPVAMGGGGFVTGVFSTSEEGLYYARTDVGGAYRWDNTDSRWVQLGAFVNEDQVGLLGIDGMAVDPSNPAKIVLAAGTEYFNGGETAILVSEDYGVNFDIVYVTDMIKVHGNGMGRQNGERVAIDPNNTDIIYVGGRTGGLIRSEDGGKTFSSVSSFPVTSTSNGVGINCILISDSGDIYCAASQASEPNVYRSTDDGKTWSEVTALSNKYMVQRLRFDANGDILVAFGATEGPHSGLNEGRLMRYSPSTDTAEDISPNMDKFGDVISDPANADRLVACTENCWVAQPNGSHGDEFYVSNDGGKNWTSINSMMTMSTGGIDWVSSASMHWSGCLMIDQNNPNRLMTVSGNGIWACDNIWDSEPEFYFNSVGIEETVPFDVVSVPNGPLLTTIGDYDGFIQDDAFEYGQAHFPQLGSASSIAAAMQNTQVMIRVANESMPYISTDGGYTWRNTKTPGNNQKGGIVGISADGTRLYWSPTNDMSVYYSEDMGETWLKSEGLFGPVYIKGDTVNSDYVYCGTTNAFYVSSDGGKTFSKTFDDFSGVSRFMAAYNREGMVYYIGTGLYVSEDYGKTFTRLNAAKVTAVGLGTGKTESDPLAIYIYGQPTGEDTLGVYWSTDEGETWERVNDDLHRYGGLGNGNLIAGDMNVYGRCYMSTVGMGVICFDKIEK